MNSQPSNCRQFHQTRQIYVGNVAIGGGAPVIIQSMTNTDTRDVTASLAQIRTLANAGCQIARLAVPDLQSAHALEQIVAESPIPLIADIHFDYRLAIASIEAGIAAIRINPGNIGSNDRVKAVVEAAGNANVPIRVGANAGSLPKGMLQRKLALGIPHDAAVAEALVEAAMLQVQLLESFQFHQIKVSLKSSNVPVTVAAYRRFAECSDYPLHIGITEAGTVFRGTVKSAVGIGALLLDGIGDTMRVSLTADPVEEIKVAIAILEAAGRRSPVPEIVSCPTCARTAYDLFALAEKVEQFVESLKQAGQPIKVRKIAVMGCVVNGPGEASDAEIGIAGGGEPGKLMVFQYGKTVAVLDECDAFAYLADRIANWNDAQSGKSSN